MLGRKNHLAPTLAGVLSEDVSGQIDWTQFVHCDLSRIKGEYYLKPIEMRNRRLSAMGKTKAILKIPEGTEKLSAGTEVGFYANNIDFGIFTTNGV